jgi:hypothetical protein
MYALSRDMPSVQQSCPDAVHRRLKIGRQPLCNQDMAGMVRLLEYRFWGSMGWCVGVLCLLV